MLIYIFKIYNSIKEDGNNADGLTLILLFFEKNFGKVKSILIIIKKKLVV